MTLVIIRQFFLWQTSGLGLVTYDGSRNRICWLQWAALWLTFTIKFRPHWTILRRQKNHNITAHDAKPGHHCARSNAVTMLSIKLNIVSFWLGINECSISNKQATSIKALQQLIQLMDKQLHHNKTMGCKYTSMPYFNNSLVKPPCNLWYEEIF